MVFLCLSRCVFIYSSQKFQSMRIIIFVLQLKITEGLRQIVLEHGILAFKFSPSLPGPFTKSNTPPDPCHIHLLARLCFLLKKFFDSTLMKLTPLSPFALHFFFFHMSSQLWSKPTLCGSICKCEAEHCHVPLRVFCATKYLCWQVTVERISCAWVAGA